MLHSLKTASQFLDRGRITGFGRLDCPLSYHMAALQDREMSREMLLMSTMMRGSCVGIVASILDTRCLLPSSRPEEQAYQRTAITMNVVSKAWQQWRES
mmetsp:Transcript_31842/g.85066  ORF Transcript_31842/g.85066 Transcript_31842/m.85066 type:complete len:99 (+) Transcript_31842:89-385(+)